MCISAYRWRLPSISCCWQFSNTDDQFHIWSTSIFILLQSLHEHNQWNSILTNIMISFQSIPFSIICLIFIRINQVITLLVSGHYYDLMILFTLFIDSINLYSFTIKILFDYSIQWYQLSIYDSIININDTMNRYYQHRLWYQNSFQILVSNWYMKVILIVSFIKNITYNSHLVILSITRFVSLD